MKDIIVICFFSAVFGAVGCTSTSTLSNRATSTVSHATASDAGVSADIGTQLCAISGLCNTLYAEGTITMRNGGSSQSGQFTLRSKRASAGGDSLSMVVTGPFGMTAAKFLGSASEFSFYNAIRGENYHGKPDPRTLEEFTGMKGLSLSLLNDLVYGVPPSVPSTIDGAKTETVDAEHSKVIYCKPGEQCTEAVTYIKSGNSIRITSYDRWNHIIDSVATHLVRPDLNVTFTGLLDDSKFRLPNLITARSGSQSLEIEYTQAKENDPALNVRIKMPN